MITKRLLCALVLLLWCMGLYAQELRLVLQINTKIQENNKEIGNTFNSRVTIPGRPVEIKLVGDNLTIEVRFTPYLRQGKYALVAQSQIWINVPNRGMSYKTNTHSIPIDFGEPILYFPLGSDSASDNPLIELQITMYRYGEEPNPAEGSSRQPRPREGGRGTESGERHGGSERPAGSGQQRNPGRER
ncbi:MAG: hypothetical protein LBH07_01890 [Treponema sp.]|jgi:hypothetical protein|nr:hypothetical protein [Treponema sp.]